MILTDLLKIQLKTRQYDGKTSVFDPVRRQWISLTPEEHVRQLLLSYLTNSMQYPLAMIAVEKSIKVGPMSKRFDIVVYSRDHKPWLLVECKAPEINISEKTLYQLLNYQRSMQCSYWLLTNGLQAFCADASDPSAIKWMQSLPVYDL